MDIELELCGSLTTMSANEITDPDVIELRKRFGRPVEEYVTPPFSFAVAHPSGARPTRELDDDVVTGGDRRRWAAANGKTLPYDTAQRNMFKAIAALGFVGLTTVTPRVPHRSC